MSLNKTNVDIDRNIRVHNRIAKSYERSHGEIYNEIEQDRLRQSLKLALTHVATCNTSVTSLDFGCGAGNLTAHLSSLGCKVIACDVSKGFLDLINSRNYETNVKTVQLNGKNLSSIPDNSVDFVATYSVIHHVPDYLAIIEEFIRVLRVGGVLYVDHERSENFWLNNAVYKNFDKIMRLKSKRDFRKYLTVTNYIDWVIRKFINTRYRREGDIHVFYDDHVCWEKITNVLHERAMDIVMEEDYLLFKSNYDFSIYNKNKDIIHDTHLLVAKKLKD